MFSLGQRAWGVALALDTQHLLPDPIVSLAPTHSRVLLDSDSKLQLSQWPENSAPGELDP